MLSCSVKDTPSGKQKLTSALQRDIALATANMECWKTLAAIHIWVLGFWIPVWVWEEHCLRKQRNVIDMARQNARMELHSWPPFSATNFHNQICIVSSSLLTWNGLLQNLTPKISNFQSQPYAKLGSFRPDEGKTWKGIIWSWIILGWFPFYIHEVTVATTLTPTGFSLIPSKFHKTLV